MILNNAPENQAILSNVGEIGEFRIRNSAKAFNILSSGLYANKIRAVIRELSCNAVDSHVAAGKGDVPFEVHLPNSLDAYFSVRDFGTGLSHDQVTSIYTTYFESTKTDSNSFIGALGLGSKSPFSYTDNFTVTAIKDGKRGIYSAFINGDGVPSIALMMEEETDEPNGVEIKFSVNERYDFNKFREEAREVYEHFKLKPQITGSSGFTFNTHEYETMDIIPGVHSLPNPRGYSSLKSVAVMGNIAYPIQVPNEETTLGSLSQLLKCGLEMHFSIGELDFQASREGLSYIPSTIEAIKNKLEAVRDQLSVHVKEKADQIPNLWDRATYLKELSTNPLWNDAVFQYATTSNLPTYVHSSYSRRKEFELDTDELASKYNITLRAGSRWSGASSIKTVQPITRHDRSIPNKLVVTHTWDIAVDTSYEFIINDLKVGAFERAKHHYRSTAGNSSCRFYVIEAADKTKSVDTAGFFAAIHNPPERNIIKASSLTEKPRKDSFGKNVTILKLRERRTGSYGSIELIWDDAGKIGEFDTKAVHYYVELSGFVMQSKYSVTDAKVLHEWLKGAGIAGLSDLTIHGVRKGDLSDVKTRKNWVNLEDHINSKLQVLDPSFIKSLALRELDRFAFSDVHKERVAGYISNPDSPYLALANEFKDVQKAKLDEQALLNLYKHYNTNQAINPSAEVAKYVKKFEELHARYPLLEYLQYNVPSLELASYINLIDKSL